MTSVSRLELCAYLVQVVLDRTPPYPLRVAVDGPDCAGKSILADEVAARLAPVRPVRRLAIDDFHHPAAIRRRRGDVSAEGYYNAFNLPAIIEDVGTTWASSACTTDQQCSTSDAMSTSRRTG